MRPLLEILTLLGTFLGKMLYIVHFQRRSAFSPTGHLFFGHFWDISKKKNASFVDFEERNTASVDVWVIFGSFSKQERHDLAKPRASSIYIYIYEKMTRWGPKSTLSLRPKNVKNIDFA